MENKTSVRESGQYWIRNTNKFWEVASFDKPDNLWYLPGVEEPYPDDAFSEINESRLPTPDEVTREGDNCEAAKKAIEVCPWSKGDERYFAHNIGFSSGAYWAQSRPSDSVGEIPTVFLESYKEILNCLKEAKYYQRKPLGLIKNAEAILDAFGMTRDWEALKK